MNKIKKERTIDAYKEFFNSYGYVFLLRNTGLTVQDSKNARNALSDLDIKFMVVKNSLAKIAASETKFSALKDYFKGPTILAYCKEPISAAKAITSLIKDELPFEISAALLDGVVMHSEEAVSLSKLLTKDEIYAKFLGVLKAVPNQLVALLNEPSLQIARVINTRASNQ